MTVLAPLLRTRTTAVWLLLTAATLLTWSLGGDHGLGVSHGHSMTAVVILAIAIVKIRFVGLYFMELRDAPPALRAVFEIYCAAVLLTPTETSRRGIWMACIWSWPVCAVLFGISFVVVAGFLPPVLESASAEEVAAFYEANRAAKRAGLIGAMFASALLLPFFAVVSAEMRKIEGRNPLLAPIQYGGAVILTTFFQIICLLWLLASFRPEISPEIIRAANDYGWLVWTMLIPTYVLQFVCMAIAGFIDRRPHPIWPRWAAYFNVWVAVIGSGGVLAVYLKSGPFSWNGIIGIWLPLALFAIGMTINMWLLHRRAQYEATLAST